MLYSELSRLAPIAHVVTSADEDRLREGLEQILGPSGSFDHYTTVRGGPGSIRLFLQTRFDDSIKTLDGHKRPGEIAVDLLHYIEQQDGPRYPEPALEGRRKGWKLSCVKIDGKAAALVEAAWT